MPLNVDRLWMDFVSFPRFLFYHSLLGLDVSPIAILNAQLPSGVRMDVNKGLRILLSWHPRSACSPNGTPGLNLPPVMRMNGYSSARSVVCTGLSGGSSLSSANRSFSALASRDHIQAKYGIAQWTLISYCRSWIFSISPGSIPSSFSSFSKNPLGLFCHGARSTSI